MGLNSRSVIFWATGLAETGASTLTVVTAVALSWRSSNAVARTEMGPAPASVVSRCAWLRLEESLPPLATKVIASGRLSALVASQLMVELSPMRTLGGAAEHVIRGALATDVSAVVGNVPREEAGWVAETGRTGWISG